MRESEMLCSVDQLDVSHDKRFELLVRIDRARIIDIEPCDLLQRTVDEGNNLFAIDNINVGL